MTVVSGTPHARRATKLGLELCKSRLDSFAMLAYHVFVATQRRNTRASKPASSGPSRVAVLCALVFIVAIAIAFAANAETIRRNFDMFITRLNTPPGVERAIPAEPTEDEIVIEEVVIPRPPTPPPPVQPPPPDTPVPEEPPPVVTEPARPQPEVPPTPPPVPQAVDRNVFFTQIDRDGQILNTRVMRRITASPTPMTDALNAMLIGPSAEELNRGMINIIPENTRILSVIIRGSTAHINFSEDFLFNTFGIEGYLAQLRQVVWTATEFPNVSDVQVLIEGRVMDFIGDGIWIGSPISRQSF